nr:retrotransposon Gag domain, retroviral aspartyl protease [Tanacetum cinerariifolium]
MYAPSVVSAPYFAKAVKGQGIQESNDELVRVLERGTLNYGGDRALVGCVKDFKTLPNIHNETKMVSFNMFVVKAFWDNMLFDFATSLTRGRPGEILLKVKWAIEGDKNSKFFHGIINKKKRQQAIKGILVDEGNFTRILDSDHSRALEEEVSNEEIKKEFFNLSSFPYSCNSSSIALIPKEDQTLLFKVDFQKLFDYVRWDHLDDILDNYSWFKWVSRSAYNVTFLWFILSMVLKDADNLKAKGVGVMKFCKKIIKNGNKSRFWHEKWLGDVCFKVKFNWIFNLDLHKDVSVAHKLQDVDLVSSFRRCPRGEVHLVLPNQNDMMHARPSREIRLYTSKRLDNALVCYTKPFDSFENWNNHFIWVDDFACPAFFPWHTAKHVTRDPDQVVADFNAQDYATLVAHPSLFCVDRLFDEGGSGNQTKQGDSARGGPDSNIQPVVEAANTVVKDATPVQSRHQGKRKPVVVNAGEVFHPPKKPKEDHGTPSGASVGGKSRSALQRLLAEAVLNAEVEVAAIPTLPFVTASISTTPEREDGDHTDSLAEPNLRTIGAPQRFVISTDSSHYSGVFSDFTGSDFLVGAIRTVINLDTDLQKVYVPQWSVTNGSRLDDGRVCREVVDEFSPPKFFASVCRMEHDQLFTEFNVRAARQMSLSAEVRIRDEYNVKEKRRLKSVVESQSELLKAREEEIESLKSWSLLREVEAAEAIRLRADASNLETGEKSLRGETNALRKRNVILEKERNALDVKVTELETSTMSKERELTDLNALVTSLSLKMTTCRSGERKPRKGQNQIKTGQKKEATNAWLQFDFTSLRLIGTRPGARNEGYKWGKRGELDDEEPKLFGADELPRPPSKERIAKAQGNLRVRSFGSKNDNEGSHGQPQQHFRPYNKINFPSFNGGDPRGWFLKAKKYFKYYHIPNEEKVEVASMHLEGDALEQYAWLSIDESITFWEELVQASTTHFGPAEFQNHDEYLCSIKQTDSVQEYKKEFARRSSWVSNWPDHCLLVVFINGLKEELKSDLLEDDDVTEEPIYTHVVNLDENLSEVAEISLHVIFSKSQPTIIKVHGTLNSTETLFHPDQSPLITYLQHPQPNNSFVLQPSFNTNYMQQPMQNPKDISDPTTTIDMELALMDKALTLNDTTPTNNNQRSPSNPSNMQIAQPGMNMDRDRHMLMVEDNVGNQFRPNAIQNVRNQEKVGIQLNSEEFDFMAAAGAYDKIEEVNANCTLKDNLQQASTLGTQTDNAPVYDSDGSAEEKQQSLYNGKVLLEKHDPPAVYDSEETLQLAQEISVSKSMSIPNEEFSDDTTPSVAQKFLNEAKSTIVAIQHVVKQKITLDIHNWSSTAHQDIHKVIKDEILHIVNHVDARVQNLKIQFLKEAAKFVRDFKSLTKEADESLAKHKALESEKERLLRAVISQDIIKGTSVDTKLSKQSILEKPPSSFGPKLYSVTPLPKSKVIPKVGESNALSKPVTSNSVPSSRESTVVNNERVIAPRIFRINPFKASKVDNFVPNRYVKASARTKPITVSQPHVITKKDVNSNTNGFSPKDVKAL